VLPHHLGSDCGRTVLDMSMMRSSQGQDPRPSSYTPRDQIGPQPPAHPHPHPRKSRRHPLRKLASRLRRNRD
jgi:hypothetical protein